MHQHHHHAPDGHDHSSSRIGWAFVLNLTFTVIEFIGGVLTGSTAIMADAVHDLGDSISIGSAWVLNKLGQKGADEVFTYGYRRLSLFGALLNGVVLIVGSVWVLVQVLPRLLNPVMPHTQGMLLLSILGIVANGYAAFKLSGGKSLNEKILNWHLLEDVLGWVAVLIVSIALMYVDWPILDPLLALGFTAFILVNVFRNTRDTVKLFFQAAPEASMTKAIHDELMQMQEVAGIHHEHCWSLDGEHHVYTAHLQLHLPVSVQEQILLKKVIAGKLARFNLTHTTIELEFPEEACRDNL